MHFFQVSIKLAQPFPAPGLRTRILQTRGFFWILGSFVPSLCVLQLGISVYICLLFLLSLSCRTGSATTGSTGSRTEQIVQERTAKIDSNRLKLALQISHRRWGKTTSKIVGAVPIPLWWGTSLLLLSLELSWRLRCFLWEVLEGTCPKGSFELC